MRQKQDMEEIMISQHSCPVVPCSFSQLKFWTCGTNPPRTPGTKLASLLSRILKVPDETTYLLTFSTFPESFRCQNICFLLSGKYLLSLSNIIRIVD